MTGSRDTAAGAAQEETHPPAAPFSPSPAKQLTGCERAKIPTRGRSNLSSRPSRSVMPDGHRCPNRPARCQMPGQKEHQSRHSTETPAPHPYMPHPSSSLRPLATSASRRPCTRTWPGLAARPLTLLHSPSPSPQTWAPCAPRSPQASPGTRPAPSVCT